MQRIILLSIFLSTAIFPQIALASHGQTNPLIVDLKKDVQIQTPSGMGVSVAVADLGEDGVPELIVANGLGQEPRVRVLRQDGTEIGSFLAYAPTLGVGIHVVTCDLNGDGKPEIITAPERGGGPQVRVFDHLGKTIGVGTFVYDQTFRGGVNLVCGDVLGDARDELITLPEAGGGPHVRVWNLEKESLALTTEFFAFDATDRHGLTGTIFDHQLIVSQQHTHTPIIRTFSLTQSSTKRMDEQSFSVEATGISSMVIHNHHLLASTTSNATLVDLTAHTTKKISDTIASVVLVSADLNTDGEPELIQAQARPSFDNQDKTRILVDLSQQRLYAYTDGILENSFLISSGKNNATPIGNHSILAKIPKVRYRWVYGPGDPRNYDLGLVPYNLRFKEHLYIHYAYWHNNFGHPMSRGCVNVSLTNIKWLYDWATPGMAVDIVK
ncbi:L,D-transpeptidase family protein [Candidatus Uhrbacteria bacterium]|nr:L,D-transpeptidase family protein [Candidatus Uhrbacteria bacterium]